MFLIEFLHDYMEMMGTYDLYIYIYIYLYIYICARMTLLYEYRIVFVKCFNSEVSMLIVYFQENFIFVHLRFSNILRPQAVDLHLRTTTGLSSSSPPL